MQKRSFVIGFLGSLALLVLYFSVLSLISGWNFAWSQFSQFWYFIISLDLGFGVQVGLYARLRRESKVLGVTGVTSTVSMISCCAHYFANLLPVLGLVGIVTFVAQYQVELFWLGIIFNLGGIVYMESKVYKINHR